MKYNFMSNVVLAVAIITISLISTASANAQGGGGMEPVAETGMLFLNADQTLTITVKKRSHSPGHFALDLNRTTYVPPVCTEDGTCTYSKCCIEVASWSRIENDDAISWEIRPTPGVARQAISVFVSSNRAPNKLEVTGVISTVTIGPNGERIHNKTGHVTLMK